MQRRTWPGPGPSSVPQPWKADGRSAAQRARARRALDVEAAPPATAGCAEAEEAAGRALRRPRRGVVDDDARLVRRAVREGAEAAVLDDQVLRNDQSVAGPARMGHTISDRHPSPHHGICEALFPPDQLIVGVRCIKIQNPPVATPDRELPRRGLLGDYVVGLAEVQPVEQRAAVRAHCAGLGGAAAGVDAPRAGEVGEAADGWRALLAVDELL
mmetsp:Transcript_35610/g.101436  ORF Transcript_35610/g.101436 Transcript_35610/m.101436 type:complete len:214 (+) Transcript_35610:93-734(+)